jgi:HD-GYP domain-containing protein (c-di-GMP phosphodiesterase class II)
MRRITLDEIKPGMYLIRPLFSDDGKVLLHEGIEIKERYIQSLRNLGFTNLFVGEPENILGLEEDFHDERHRKQAMAAAREVVGRFRVGKGINLERVKHFVSALVDKIGQDRGNMNHLLDIRRKEEHIFCHSINTCVLSIMTGIALSYDTKQLEELGLAAMLHDVGKTKFSRRLAMQFPDSLTKREHEEYRRHTYYSLEILRETPGLSVNVINACFQHHERWNGSGYPIGLRQDAISEYAQIISIADTYERLIAGLPHRRPVSVYYAVAILNKAAGEYFAPAVVEKFNQNVAVYPIGRTVWLSSRQNATILGVGINSKTTPVVRILGADSAPTAQVVELDLKKNPDLFILDLEEVTPSYVHTYSNNSAVAEWGGMRDRLG